MEEKVQRLMVAAVLAHGLIVAFSGTKPCKMRSRAFSLARDLGYPVDPQHALKVLLIETDDESHSSVHQWGLRRKHGGESSTFD
ncbi:hypothetical protein MTO96_036574, partial [Rhipicephalus appendiculatus]